MALTRYGFLGALTATVPEAQPTVQEHLADQEGELLLHLLTADLLRLAIAWHLEGRREPLMRLLHLLDGALREGDEHVNNAMAVSFVEDTG